jgi:rhodanese-related sulfurtransferase
MKKGIGYVSNIIVLMILSVFLASGGQAVESPKKEEIAQKQAAAAFEISTAELRQILLEGKIPVIDVRPGKEYEMSHIPGAINIFETELERMAQLCPDKSLGPVLYCNGPYCHKTVRVAEGLSKKGYRNIRKYQDGLPVWRALGNAAETALPGLKHVFTSDKTAVFVDARTKEEFKTGSLPGAVNLQANELEAANQDGRLPYTDHGTRVIVFGNSPNQARQLAEAISQRAYWNTSYLAGTYEELKKAGLW